MALDLKFFFERIGAYYTGELKQNIRKQQGIDGGAFQPVKFSTAVSRIYANNPRARAQKAAGLKQTRKERSLTSAKLRKSPLQPRDFKRLLFTGRLAEKAFLFEAGMDFCRVFLNEDYHTVGKTRVPYDDIIHYNNKGEGTNPANPLVWPKTDQELAMMKANRKAVSDFGKLDVQDVILKQLTADFVKNTKTEINL